MAANQHGGSRDGAGRHHEHEQYVVVQIIDFYGDKDSILAGPVLLANGNESRTVMGRAENIATHHVEEGAQEVKIVKRWCCVPQESEVIRVVKELSETDRAILSDV